MHSGNIYSWIQPFYPYASIGLSGYYFVLVAAAHIRGQALGIFH